MDIKQIEDLLQEENEARAEKMAQNAKSIISEILRINKLINDLQVENERLRGELKKLEAETVDVKEVLGTVVTGG